MRSCLLLLAVFVHTLLQGQPIGRLITLTGLDSTQLVTTFAVPGEGFLIVARQAGSVGSGCTLIRTDPDGVPLDALHSPDPITKAVACSDSGYLFLAGDRTLLKVDDDLNVQWASTMSAPPLTWFAMDIAEQDGAYYLAGNVRSQVIDTFQLNYNAYAAVLLKFNGTGDLVDHVILADTTHTSFQYNLYQPMLAPDSDGSLYVGLSMLPDALSGTCNRQPTLVKLNADLDVLWGFRYPPSSYNGLRGVSRLLTGDLALYGDFGTTVGSCNNFHHFLQVIDTTGTVNFAREYHHAAPLSHGTGKPLLLPDSTLLFAQVTSTAFPFVSTRSLHHVDAQGNTIASKVMSAAAANYAASLVSLSTDADGAIGVCRLNAKDTLLFMVIDTTLNTACYTQPDTIIDGTLSITRFAFLPHYLEHPFAFSDTLFAPFQSVPVSAVPDCDLSAEVLGSAEADLLIFPNPSTGSVRITSSFPIEELTVTDATGRTVERSAPHTPSTELELEADGLYFIRLFDGQRIQVRRLVVEAR